MFRALLLAVLVLWLGASTAQAQASVDDLELELEPLAPRAPAKKTAPKKKRPRRSLDQDRLLDVDIDAPQGVDTLELELPMDELELAPLVPSAPPASMGFIAAPVAPPSREADPPMGRFDVALKAGGLLFSGRTDAAVLAASAAPTGRQGLAIPAMVEARVRPFDAFTPLAVSVETGFFSKSGEVHRELPFDPDFGDTTSSYSLIAVPVNLGATFDLPWRFVSRRIGIGLRGAFTAQYTRSESRWTSGGETVTYPALHAVALGWLVGVEMNVRVFAAGSLVLDVRYGQALTDFGLPAAYEARAGLAAQPFNRDSPGDVQGTNALLGYRQAF